VARDAARAVRRHDLDNQRGPDTNQESRIHPADR
jgi:hypothetical protein